MAGVSFRLAFADASELGSFQAAVATAGAPTITGTTSADGGTPPLLDSAGGATVTIAGGERDLASRVR